MLRSRFLGRAIPLLILIGLSRPAAADRRTDQIVSALGSAAHVVGVVSAADWTWTKVDLADEAVPLRIDILVTNGANDGRVLYVFPGAGVNFESDFFIPRDQNLAHFMRNRGYVVIGVNSRANSLPSSWSNAPFLAQWGLAKLRADEHAVITKIQSVMSGPFDILGHSLGGLAALDYAAAFPNDPQKLFVLDFSGTYDPVAEPNFVRRSQISSSGYQKLIDGKDKDGNDVEKKFTIDTGNALKQLAAAAFQFPMADSGVPRNSFALATGSGPVGGDFTLLGLIAFTSILSNLLPGDITPLTVTDEYPYGLPMFWFCAQFFAGTYTFNADPLLDSFSFTQSQLPVVAPAFFVEGNNIVPTAQFRDLFAVLASSGSYGIQYENIRAKVNWVGASLGNGNHPYTARRIAAASNAPVHYSVVDGYGHNDVVYGSNAIRDVWPLLVAN